MEINLNDYDFHGWATKANLKCSDGRTIMKDAFAHNNGITVPLVWNHQHDGPENTLGHALLENRPEGVYAYCSFNDTENGQLSKVLVQHGDIKRLSIYANQLKQQGGNVLHGEIREVSLVHAGANPGAVITSVIAHSDDGEPIIAENECIIHTGMEFSIDKTNPVEEEIIHAENPTDKKEDETVAENTKAAESGENLADLLEEALKSLDEKHQNAIYAAIGMAMEHSDTNNDESEGGDNSMKHNVFDQDERQANVLTHSDQEAIIALAKSSGVGSLQDAIGIYAKENGSLAHGFVNEDGDDAIETLFPEFHDTNTGAPNTIKRDQSWVMSVINKIHKSPYSRIRTRHADARIAELRAKGYQQKGDEKTLSGNIKLLSRTTDPQTVYRKDQLNRDDILDITDFDVVAYQWGIMKENMYEELALAALVGDGRDDGDPDKIHETHIRSIYNDEELYTIHQDVDIEAARAELQGSNTSANFGENYIYAEAIITAALYSREKFKGSGTPDLYCTPHLLNVMLLARDLNGRRIYDSKTDLAAALNVGAIHTIEQLEGKTRTTKDGKTKKLLGLFVNLADYQFGSTKGGELTKFEDFDIDFNQYKYLIETRLSGALTKVYSAIALEEPVVEAAG